MNPPRSRGRPRTFDREAILEVAVDEFARHGYEGVSIADLTSSLGCTAPTLYSLFGSKDGLFREALDRYVSRGFGVLGDVLTGPQSTRLRLEGWMRVTIKAITAPDHARGCFVLVGGLTSGPAGSEAAAALAAQRAMGLAALRTQLTQAQRDGELRADVDLEALSRFYFGVMQGIAAQALDGATEAELEPVMAVALAAWPGTPTSPPTPPPR